MWTGPLTWIDTSKLLQPTKPICIAVDMPHLCSSLPIIYFQVEPEAIVAQKDYLITNYDKYYKILTFNDEVLRKCPNAISYVYGTTWIERSDFESIHISNKKFKVTSIVGDKYTTVGHRFRISIFNFQEYIFQLANSTGFELQMYISEGSKHRVPINSLQTPYLSSLGKYKIDLFKDAQFHICIENSKQTNYFTEKLVDTLITKTIPIYYGCPNISDYFNTSGWIILEKDDVNELCEKLKQLSPDWYTLHLSTVEENYQKALTYIDFYTNVNKVLESVL